MKQDGLKETNHYLSRSFLKNFVNSQKKINIYNLLVPRENFGIWIQSSVGGTAYRKNLYTYLSSNGLTDEFETWFNEEIEDPAAASIKKVLSYLLRIGKS